ncbi:hypothetical protein B9G98_01572 [Wickerhamiella sorbophila]|uniref:Uncharacterized protein n=1 Tax=Wickerhamiella sorbophila TaxID=45607 RepID=A0A2T0FG29_9ASCO|nr:hypothetical protein B9G98_01572 [Wickerhamiella sorbophila]PRT53952.1 hypothetical protein B9G98_01572 [Wickerhamiella sorbophila]
MEDVLSKVSIVVSPALAQFAPVTLPYGYKQVESVPEVDTSSLPLIICDSDNYLAGLAAKHESRIAAMDKWKRDKKQRDIEEKKRLAPGYFDGTNRLLVPTAKQPPPETPENDALSIENLHLS